jgi:hypothetical protein
VALPKAPALFFGYHDAHPAVLAGLLFAQFGVDWLEWDSEALWYEVEQDFSARFQMHYSRPHSVTVSAMNKNKIQAVRNLLLSDGFWSAWEVFSPLTQALNNNTPDFFTLQQPTVAQMMAAVDMVSDIRKRPYEEEVSRFVAASALDRGVWFLPDPLSFAQRLVAQPTYVCTDCGNEDDDDLADGRCDVCVGRFNPDMDEKSLNLKPARGIPDDVGRNIERHFKNDPRPVAARWRQVLGETGGESDLSDDVPEDVVCAKLLVAHNYMVMRRQQEAEQAREFSWLLSKKVA